MVSVGAEFSLPLEEGVLGDLSQEPRGLKSSLWKIAFGAKRRGDRVLRPRSHLLYGEDTAAVRPLN